MKTAEINTTIMEGYVSLLNNLSPNNKLDLISKLTASVKSDLTNKKSLFKKAFGALESKKSTNFYGNANKGKEYNTPVK